MSTAELDKSLADAATDLPPFLTPKQFRTRYQISHGKTYDLIQSGVVKSVTIGRCRRIPKAAAIEFENSLMGDD